MRDAEHREKLEKYEVLNKRTGVTGGLAGGLQGTEHRESQERQNLDGEFAAPLLATTAVRGFTSLRAE